MEAPRRQSAFWAQKSFFSILGPKSAKFGQKWENGGNSHFLHHGAKRLVNVMVFGCFRRPEMQKTFWSTISFAFLEPKCGKCAESAKRVTFEHLGSLLPPPPPARPGQLWWTPGRRSPDVSQASLSLGLSGWLPQAGGEHGRVGGCPPPTPITAGGLFGIPIFAILPYFCHTLQYFCHIVQFPAILCHIQ